MEKFDFKKHWQGFIDGKIAIHCKTNELAQEFLKYCNREGLKWCNESVLITDFNWNKYEENTCYNYEDIGMFYGHIQDFLSDNYYLIVEFNGMVSK